MDPFSHPKTSEGPRSLAALLLSANQSKFTRTKDTAQAGIRVVSIADGGIGNYCTIPDFCIAAFSPSGLNPNGPGWLL